MGNPIKKEKMPKNVMYKATIQFLIPFLFFSNIVHPYSLAFNINDCADLIEFKYPKNFGCKDLIYCCELYCVYKRHMVMDVKKSACSKAFEQFVYAISLKSTKKKRFVLELCECKYVSDEQLEAAKKALEKKSN